MFSEQTFNEYEEQLKNELFDFYPGRVFDIHAHIYRKSDFDSTAPEIIRKGPAVSDINAWRLHMKELFVSEPFGGLFMPFPAFGCDIVKANSFLIKQLDQSRNSKGLLMVSPSLSKDEILNQLKFDPVNIAGFKPYHTFSRHTPTMDSRIDDFVPEWVFEFADEKSMVIMLHLVKDKALSDPDNQNEIISKCTKYPQMKLILAHAARGFNPENTIKGLHSLRGLDNLYFDTSAICEPDALKAILYEFGPKKLLWGSDFPVSQIKGKCVSIGDGFMWLDNASLTNNIIAGSGPLPVGLESLAALRKACIDFGLNDPDKEDIFFNNSYMLLGYAKKINDKTQKLYDHAKKIIPGGTQLLSKRPEMFAPGKWPAYFSEARGCEVWDTDGKHYYDMSTNSVGSCLLGYRDDDVSKAVIRRVNLGSMCSLNAYEEVCLADALIDIHPWAEQVRFARTGGEIAAIAVRIARAATDRSMVAISGYHGWHDWYLSANLGNDDALRGHLLPGLEPMGVPRELRGTAVTFKNGDFKEFDEVMDKYGDKLAAVIMEPCRHHDPVNGFLEHVRLRTEKKGIVLIFDEITVGWRRVLGGSHLMFGTEPDLAIFGKALGNGHPIAAVIGREAVMRGAQSSFISSTYWTESIGPAAALAVIKKLRDNDIPSHINNIGELIRKHWKLHSIRYGIPVITDEGYACFANFKFDHPKSRELATIYTHLMLDRGFLAGTQIYPTFSHTEKIVRIYSEAIEEVFGIIAGYIDSDSIDDNLNGPVAHTGFRRLLD